MLVQEEPRIDTPDGFGGGKTPTRRNFNSSYLHLRHGLWFDRSNISRWVCNSHRLFNFSGDFGFLDGLCLDSLETNTQE